MEKLKELEKNEEESRERRSIVKDNRQINRCSRITQQETIRRSEIENSRTGKKQKKTT